MEDTQKKTQKQKQHIISLTPKGSICLRVHYFFSIWSSVAKFILCVWYLSAILWRFRVLELLWVICIGLYFW